MDSTKSAWGMSYKDSTRAGDVADFCDSLWLTLDSKGWANAPSRTGLGGPDGDPSPSVSALRAPSLSQEESDK